MVTKCLICEIPMIHYTDQSLICTHCEEQHPGLIARLRREVMAEINAEEREAIRELRAAMHTEQETIREALVTARKRWHRTFAMLRQS